MNALVRLSVSRFSAREPEGVLAPRRATSLASLAALCLLSPNAPRPMTSEAGVHTELVARVDGSRARRGV